MSKKPFLSKSLWLPLISYTAVLCIGCQAYAFLARYELFMQTLTTLFPVIVFTILLLTLVANALLLARQIPLWLLLAAHVLILCWWLLSLQIHDGEFPSQPLQNEPLWLLPLVLTLNLLPPLLGYALFRLRRKQIRSIASNPAATAASAPTTATAGCPATNAQEAGAACDPTATSAATADTTAAARFEAETNVKTFSIGSGPQT